MIEHSTKRNHFPSIPNRSRIKNSSQVLKAKKSQSPHHRSHSPQLISQYCTINIDEVRNQQRVISHFLMKYLERKQNYQIRENDFETDIEHFYLRDSNRISPVFRRNYIKKMRQQKKFPTCKFIIGVL